MAKAVDSELETSSCTSSTPIEPKRRKTCASDSDIKRLTSETRVRQVHVLAFGDSLTAGGFGSTPYPTQLEELLKANNAGEKAYCVHNVGICGESTESMVERLPRELDTLVRSGRRPAFVLILGGTNDLGHLTPQEILKNLMEMCSAASEIGAKPFVLTIPRDEYGFGPVARVLNRKLRAEFAHVVDTTCVGNEHLSDGVHFTTAGYGEFAKLVLEAMMPFI